MDNIGIEVYALCCLLPFVAFLTLAVQIYANSHAKNTLRGKLNAANDDFLCSMQGLITITEDRKRERLFDHTDCAYRPADTHRKEQKCNELSFYDESRKESSFLRKEPLTGCNAGLAKMKLINQKYLSNRRASVGVEEGRVRRVRRGRREDFKPTYLPIIMEGLQY
jgi:hypothetical protein